MSMVQANIERFNQRLDSQEGKDKLAEMGGSWIRDNAPRTQPPSLAVCYH